MESSKGINKNVLSFGVTGRVETGNRQNDIFFFAGEKTFRVYRGIENKAFVFGKIGFVNICSETRVVNELVNEKRFDSIDKGITTNGFERNLKMD
ncbi:TPA: hypothetical protein DGD59_02985 [Candidatus Collierbacteria bacterium]|nr:hypothetical protein [Candidatus Collierbacteria bacterium]